MPAAPQIVWLASYPRSGNTWVRTLLHGYFEGEPVSSKDIARLIPDIHAPTHGGGPVRPLADTGRTLIKTHYLWSRAHPLASATLGVIYLLRHPRDVLLSSLNFHRVMGSKGGLAGGKASADFDAVAYLRTCLNRGGDPGFLDAGFGTWEQNARSWTETCDAPRLVVRYDALRSDPEPHLRAIVEFLGQTPDADRVARALRAGSFDNMRALEVREKSATGERNAFFGGSVATLRKGFKFMDKGRVGGRLDEVAPGFDAAFDQRFGPAIKALGLDQPA